MGAPIVEVRQGSVTDADVDVLVNASNTLGRLGSGVSNAIRVACGAGFQESILRALRPRGGALAPGEALLTHAGTHPRAKFVVHVAVMDYREGARQVFPDEARIRKGSDRVWRIVEDELPPGAYSIGMVALGAGTGGLGERLPTSITCASLQAHLAARATTKLARVVFHGYTPPEYANVRDVVRAAFPGST